MALAPTAEATVLRGLTISDLRGHADLIVEGRVVSVETTMQDGRIESVATVRVRDSHKGAASRRIEVRSLGGELGGQRLVVPGAPRLAKGEEVLLFLYRSSTGLRPVGMFQGVWRLDAETGMARRSGSGGASLLRESEAALAVDVAERSVRRLVGRGGGR